VFVCPTQAQDTGNASTEFYGKGTAVTIMVHDAAGNPIRAAAMVKLFHAGTMPAGQAQTEGGRAEMVVTELGDFTAVVAAPGYASVQREFSVDAAGKAQVDVVLRALSIDSAPPAGRPLLAPKAQKAVDKGLQALSTDNLGEAQKQAATAMHLAPGHPDVLYLQGIVLLKERDWSKAQETLEKATQVDPAHANAFAALGMALCDLGKYEAAIAPLEKALQLNPALSWDARWTLAQAYYRQARYDQALDMSQAALLSSHGRAPQIELLVAQSLTAVGRYEDAGQALREFLRNHSDLRESATARRWLDGLAANGKIRAH
jgi:tetratricopeptide (TPR) repeat protein